MKKLLLISLLSLFLSACSLGDLKKSETESDLFNEEQQLEEEVSLDEKQQDEQQSEENLAVEEEVKWELPITLGSTKEEVKKVLGDPETGNIYHFEGYKFMYYNEGISLSFDANNKVYEIILPEDGFNMLGDEMKFKAYDGQMPGGISLSMNINEVIQKLGNEHIMDDSNADWSATKSYIWHKPSYDIKVNVYSEEYEDNGIVRPKDSISTVIFTKVFSGEEVKNGEEIIDEFYAKYNVLHSGKVPENEIFSKELYINNEKVGDFETYQIFSYGTKENFYYLKDNDFQDLECNGDILKENKGLSLIDFVEPCDAPNRICIYKDDKEFISNRSPFIVTDEFVIYTKCLQAGYDSKNNQNSCLQVGLFLNENQIDSLSLSEINIRANGYYKSKIYFENFKKFNNSIIYNKNGTFMYYDTKSKNSVKLDSAYFTDNEEGIVIIDIDVDNDGKIGFIVENINTDTGEIKYNLGYNGVLYEDIYAFRLMNNNLYYAKKTFEKEMDNSFSKIHKIELMKNKNIIAEFYIDSCRNLQGYSMGYNPLFIDVAQGCKSDICIHSDNNISFVFSDYDEKVKINSNGYYEYEGLVFKDIMLGNCVFDNGIMLNNNKIVLNKDQYKYSPVDNPSAIYPVIENDIIEYLLIGDAYVSTWYLRKNGEEVDYKLYEGGEPMNVYKK